MVSAREVHLCPTLLASPKGLGRQKTGDKRRQGDKRRHVLTLDNSAPTSRLALLYSCKWRTNWLTQAGCPICRCSANEPFDNDVLCFDGVPSKRDSRHDNAICGSGQSMISLAIAPSANHHFPVNGERMLRNLEWGQIMYFVPFRNFLSRYAPGQKKAEGRFRPIYLSKLDSLRSDRIIQRRSAFVERTAEWFQREQAQR